MGFSRQEYWRGLPPGHLPNPGSKPWSPASPALQVGSLPLRHQGNPQSGLGTLFKWETWNHDSMAASSATHGWVSNSLYGPSYCSHEIKRPLHCGRKTMTNLDSTLKSRDIILLTKVWTVKAMVFPVVRYQHESWTTKKPECGRIDVFDMWCWRGLLRVPLTARRSNQSILKEVNPECSFEVLMLKLKLQYFGQLMQIANSLKKTLMLVNIEDKMGSGSSGCDGQMAPLSQWTEVWTNSRRKWGTEEHVVLQSVGLQIVRQDLATEQPYISHHIL